MDAYRHDSKAAEKRAALIDATREPLASAHLLIELLESMEDASHKVADHVASDFGGGVKLICAAFRAVMMAVENNLRDDDAEQLRERTTSNHSSLVARFDLVGKALRRAGST
ncbi:cyclodeaminase/cyclohydrolase family protein [Rhizobium populisoli]|uniref:cyclodeaminase/cyclohydrolase family protein n=1 Tax=Rhizobium populisoli TaxID=2859785 RepID=UPI0028A96AD9|nr:cyclodeaminase/cyclohydrolase family protein [Rhizobium populisoli]